MLEVVQICKRFGGVTALDRVSLTVAEGEIVGLIGPNGAGKTTLFHVISGFVRPDGGRLRFAGREVIGLPPHRICHLGLARTFQIVQPFTQMSVVDNVAVGCLFGRRDGRTDVRQARDAALRLLDLVELTGVSTLPAHALNLSERKRLEIARALATGPRLLCLDEAMSGLTTAELDRMVHTIRRVHAELHLAVLMVEHNVRLVTRTCPRLVVLNYGQVVADGPTETVVRDPRVVGAYLGTRSGAGA
ncbi:MAG: ABC transporter ATP-binding protein [Armatimonadota bacterium]|nr:ABC transporter ATP-binding protein [Armatimonadota bacterium]MDR7422609.1 ABC transporter ATP-binding protein [Armatimonadota bacterium]MDR7453568.1 ABC transporter ATP-binding protein [Armatimonadota bacterium]MDR7456386.1 ABC transporter ATP-binding protein [Armatimonadota bacterium]MDR7496682.1 ABC transporter ATP-binding protein [Armatimonadota bacterium]